MRQEGWGLKVGGSGLRGAGLKVDPAQFRPARSHMQTLVTWFESKLLQVYFNITNNDRFV